MCMVDEEVEFAGVEDAGEVTNGDLSRSRLTKFMFTKDLKLLLMQAVHQHDAHISPHEKKEE